MARQPQDREDLLRDATAYPTRLQLRCSLGGKECIVFVGFRENGAASLYYDQDPVYHFNASAQLRRAFVDGKLLKAERRRLVALLRQEQDDEIALLRKELSHDEQQLVCDLMQQHLSTLHNILQTGEYQIEGQVQMGQGDEAFDRLLKLLEDLNEIQIAIAPHVAG